MFLFCIASLCVVVRGSVRQNCVLCMQWPPAAAMRLVSVFIKFVVKTNCIIDCLSFAWPVAACCNAKRRQGCGRVRQECRSKCLRSPTMLHNNRDACIPKNNTKQITSPGGKTTDKPLRQADKTADKPLRQAEKPRTNHFAKRKTQVCCTLVP